MINPEHEAEELIQDLDLKHPIKPQCVCDAISTNEFKIEYREKPLEKESLCGISIGDRNGAQIVVNSNIINPERRLFSAAHEIGHVVLHIQRGVQSRFTCKLSEIQPDNNKNQKKAETEANQFAATLLMPKFLIEKDIRSNDITWHFVQKLAKKYQVSLEATARRIINITKDQCALIIHKDNQMWTPISSASFPCFIPQLIFSEHLQILELNTKTQFSDTLEECDLSDWGLELDSARQKT